MNKDFLIKCWKHPRWHSLMVLIIWIIVLLFLSFVVSIVNIFTKPIQQPEVKQEEVKTISYSDKWSYLLNDNYAYTYLIKKDNETIKFNGEKHDSVITGYREKIDGIIKYTIKDEIVYETFLDKMAVIDNLYENVLETFLNPALLYDLIKEIPANNYDVIENNDITTYEYNSTLDNIPLNIIVTTNKTEITNVDITYQNEIYNLEYSLIN